MRPIAVLHRFTTPVTTVLHARAVSYGRTQVRGGHDATHHHSVISCLGGCPRLRASSGDVLRDGDSGGESGAWGGCRLVGGIRSLGELSGHWYIDVRA